MSTKRQVNETDSNKSVVSNTTEYQNNGESELKSHYQQGGRYFLKDPDSGASVNIARLTAYAEYGEEIHERVVHHEIPLLKVDALRFLDAQPRAEHTRYEQQEPDPVEVDGFPLHRVGL